MEGGSVDIVDKTSFSDGEIGHGDRGAERATYFLVPRKRGWPLSPLNYVLGFPTYGSTLPNCRRLRDQVMDASKPKGLGEVS